VLKSTQRRHFGGRHAFGDKVFGDQLGDLVIALYVLDLV
jgi:hypothetical protein